MKKLFLTLCCFGILVTNAHAEKYCGYMFDALITRVYDGAAVDCLTFITDCKKSPSCYKEIGRKLDNAALCASQWDFVKAYKAACVRTNK